MVIDHLYVQEPEPVDWEYYRKTIGSRLVDMYKEAYDSMYSFCWQMFHPCFHFTLIHTILL